MEYFKINNNDFSHYVSGLKVNHIKNYNSQTNAAGNTVIDIINTKRVIEVSFIPMNDEDIKGLLYLLTTFHTLNISYREPKTGFLSENVLCIASDSEIEYYTIQQNNISYKAFAVTFEEL